MTRMASKTRTPQGRAACSRAATRQASKATSKMATIHEVSMDSRAQEVATARQASKADTTVATVSKAKVAALRTEAQGSTAMR